MSSFTVNTAGVRGFATQVERASLNAGVALKYVKDHGNIDNPGGDHALMTTVQTSHKKVIELINAELQTMQKTLDGSSQDLNTAAAYYDRTDHETAVKMDQVY